jgi:hypothetical protein
MIAAAADPDDLANLRLTSKDLCAAATRPFGLSHLAHRRFIVSPCSLQGLVQLTAHPVLAPCMKSISLGTYRINIIYGRLVVEADDEKANSAALVAGNIQSEFERDGHSLHALRQALPTLKHRNIRIALGVHDDLIGDDSLHPGDPYPQGPEWTPTVRPIVRQAHGFEQLYGQLDLSRVGHREADSTMLDLCYAIKQSAYNLQALFLDFGKKMFEDDGGAWGAVLDPLVRALVFPEGSTTPVMDFTIKLSSDCADLDSSLVLRKGQSMEIVNHGISDISLQTPDLCASPYGMFTVAPHQDHFEKIVLKDCHVDKWFSNVFLRSHLGTLRHLELLGLYH